MPGVGTTCDGDTHVTEMPCVVHLGRQALAEALERRLLRAVARAAAHARALRIRARGPGPMAAPEEMFTIAPVRRGIMSARTSWLRTNGAWKFTAHERIHLLTGNSVIGR